MNKKKYELSPGELFIIPKFTFHTYECDNFMNHYYICFFDQLIGGRSLFENTTIRYQLPAKEIDRMLMLRFLELNPDCAVRNPNPKTYDNKDNLYTVNQSRSNYDLVTEIESNGILLQLFSRFLGETKFLEPEYSCKRPGRIDVYQRRPFFPYFSTSYRHGAQPIHPNQTDRTCPDSTFDFPPQHQGDCRNSWHSQSFSIL